MAETRIVVLVAMKQELAPLEERLRRPGIHLVRTGVGPRRAKAAALEHLPGATLAITAGCCGGLVASLAAGTLVVPDQILQQTGRDVQTCPAPARHWTGRARESATRLGLESVAGPLVTVNKAIFSRGSKQATQSRTNAVAVDMETAAVAQVAHELEVPHLSLRVVLDPLGYPLLSLATLATAAFRLRSVCEPLAPLIEGLIDVGAPEAETRAVPARD